MKRILKIALLGIFITIGCEKEFQPFPFDPRFIESFEKILTLDKNSDSYDTFQNIANFLDLMPFEYNYIVAQLRLYKNLERIAITKKEKDSAKARTLMFYELGRKLNDIKTKYHTHLYLVVGGFSRQEYTFNYDSHYETINGELRWKSRGLTEDRYDIIKYKNDYSLERVMPNTIQ